jgi:hypothetical protein
VREIDPFSDAPRPKWRNRSRKIHYRMPDDVFDPFFIYEYDSYGEFLDLEDIYGITRENIDD